MAEIRCLQFGTVGAEGIEGSGDASKEPQLFDHDRGEQAKVNEINTADADQAGANHGQKAAPHIGFILFGDFKKGTKAIQPAIQQNNLRGILGDGGGTGEGDRDIGFGQRNRVVDAVADVTDLLPLRLELRNQLGFILG